MTIPTTGSSLQMLEASVLNESLRFNGTA